MSKIQFETDRHPLNEITIGKLLTDDVVYFQYHEYDSLRANIGIQRLLDEKRQYIKATIQKGLNSLNIFSNSLPNLKSLYLDAPEIQSFAPLQNIATSLENFGLNNTVHFHEIPQNFPKTN